MVPVGKCILVLSRWRLVVKSKFVGGEKHMAEKASSSVKCRALLIQVVKVHA